MTLAEVLPGAKQLTAPEKLKLIRILAEDLDSGPSAEVTLSDAETAFWLQASQSSLDAVWNNDEDDVYLRSRNHRTTFWPNPLVDGVIADRLL
jgi:hypothetical protein